MGHKSIISVMAVCFAAVAHADQERMNIVLYPGVGEIINSDEPITLGADLRVGGDDEDDVGKLIISNAADVVWDEQTFTVGSTNSAGKGLGWLVVTNSTLRSKCDSEKFLDESNSSVGRGNLWIGRFSRGILEVEEDAVISNKLYVGGGGPGASSGKGVGAIYQRGGTIYPVCQQTDYKSSALGIAGTGFWQNENGNIEFMTGATSERVFMIGGYGKGIYIQRGGELNLGAKGKLGVGARNYGSGTCCILGGTVRANILTASNGNQSNIESFVTVEGYGSELLLGAYTQGCTYGPYPRDNPTKNLDQRLSINLNNGGLFQTTQIASLSDYDKYGCPYPLTVNFNGGVLRVKGSGDMFCSENAEYNFKHRVAKVAIYENGATIDCAVNGKSINVPFEPAGPGGIASIELSEPITGLIAPHIKITCNVITGYSASAIADFNTATRTVEGIHLTCHGWGYSKDHTTITIYDGATKVRDLNPEEFRVADNVTGGFTKKGSGRLMLGNTNGWCKTTSILEGELYVNCDWAVPSNTVLTLNTGATLDLNDKEITFCGLNGTGGIVENGALKLTGEWVVDAVKLAADGDSGEFDADIEINDLKVSISDETLLGADTWKYVLFSVAENRSITGIPQSVGMKGWRIEMNDRSCNLVKFRGTVFTLR
ncbi:MAG: hypothetical protein J6R18_08835 [Kiritimatiellae bacterium]|nr:hypothetical protein [Kiritimatiellia bacterium]